MPSSTLRDIFNRFRQHVCVSKAQKALRKHARRARRDRMLQVLEEAEQASHKGDSKLMYQCVRALTTGRPKVRICLKGENGDLLTSSEELDVLAEYASSLFSGEPLQLPELTPLDPESLGVEQWYRALRAIKSRKAVPQKEPAIRAWKDDLWSYAEKLSLISIECLSGATPFVPCDGSRIQIAWLPKPGKAPCTPKSPLTAKLSFWS